MFAAYAQLIAGVFCCATAVIFIRLSTIPPVLLAGARCLVASAFLFPVFLRARRRHGWPPGATRRIIAPGLLLAIHFVSWTIGARNTLATNASLIVNMVPLFMPLVLFIFLRETPSRRELAATALSVCGMLVLGFADYRISRDAFAGDVTCFASMLFFTLYLAMARQNRNVPSIWLYVVPVYMVAGVAGTAAAIVVPGSLRPWQPLDVLWLLGLGVVPTIVGHTVLNHAMRRLRGQTVAIGNMFQFVFAGLLAWRVFEEVPHIPSFPLAASLILAAAVMTVRAEDTRRVQRR